MPLEPGTLETRLKLTLRLLLVALLLLEAPLLYWSVFSASSLERQARLRRAAYAEDWQLRGKLLDCKGKVLAETRVDPKTGKAKRFYPLGQASAQVVGYLSHKFGKAGLEKGLDNALSGRSLHLAGMQHFFQQLAGLPAEGLNVQLTLDSDLQRLAYAKLGGRRGAVVAINPQTGALLVVASSPSFDPNHLAEEWQALVHHPHSALLNRPLQGLYPPGSTFKLFTAAAALDAGKVTPAETFLCEGTWKGPGTTIKCLKRSGHGEISLFDAIRLSCNIALAKTALKLGKADFYRYVERFKLTEPPPLPVPTSAGRLPSESEATLADLAEMGFGQGRLLTSPLWLALLCGTLCNHGVMYKPFLVERLTTQSGRIVFEAHPEVWARPVAPATADEVRRMMVAVVESGTGRLCRLPHVQVAGKTGTAENPEGRPHGWFIAAAPAEKPIIAIAAIVENSGTGGRNAGPIVKALLERACTAHE